MRQIAVLMLALASFCSEASASDVRVIRLQLPAKAEPTLRRIAAVFAEQITRRCDAKVVTDGDADVVVELSLDPTIGKEGYRISDGSNKSVRICGQGSRGLLYGVGKFLHTSRFEKGGFTPSVWRGVSVPLSPVRGVYFATHFHNFYHDAPIEDVRRYVEELGLWGANILEVWYDMHHFNGFDDPKAVEFRQRLHDICKTAKEIGLGVGFGIVSNEGYGNSPVELRAQKEGGKRGGWYDCQICPSKPGGLAHILADLGQEFDWWADLRPEYVWIWPYDQGGCGCPECHPWATNGFLKTFKPLAALARQKLPDIRVVLGTWFFDESDWHGLTNALNNAACPQPDYITADSVGDYPSFALDKTLRGGVPLLNFPEISMWGRDPWGGYGANPIPTRCKNLWAQTEGKLSGGVTYSEGLYEDMNKAIWLQCYWNKQCNIEETLKEYVGYEFSPAVTDDVMKAISLLEETWPSLSVGEKSLEVEALLKRSDEKLTFQAKSAWRWRLLLLRAVIDSELFRTHGELRGPTLRAAFEELTRIYHAEQADPWVRPPAVKETKM